MEITEWEGIKGKECSICLEWKPLDEFIVIDKENDAYTEECKQCSERLSLHKTSEEKKVKEDKPKIKKSSPKKVSKSKNDSYKKITYLVNNDIVDIVSHLSHLTGLDKGDVLGELVQRGLNVSKKYKEMLNDYHQLVSKYRK